MVKRLCNYLIVEYLLYTIAAKKIYNALDSNRVTTLYVLRLPLQLMYVYCKYITIDQSYKFEKFKDATTLGF